MIVVIGIPVLQPSTGDAPGVATGLAAGIACAAAAAGARVELAGRVGDDAAGDALLIALARAGVGHAATLRDPSRSTPVHDAYGPTDDGAPLVPLEADDASLDEPDAEPAAVRPDVAGGLDAGDIDLALGYLLDPRVVVVAQPLTDAGAAVVARAAAFSDASLVAVVAQDAPVPAVLDGAIVFEHDTAEGEAFATLVGRFAASLDAGTEASEAFGEARSALGWTAAEG